MRLTLIPVNPIGMRESPAFVDYADGTGELKMVTFPVYPALEKGEQLRAARVRARIGLRQGAALLAMQPVELSGLEHGRLTLSESDWDAAFEALAARIAEVT